MKTLIAILGVCFGITMCGGQSFTFRDLAFMGSLTTNPPTKSYDVDAIPSLAFWWPNTNISGYADGAAITQWVDASKINTVHLGNTTTTHPHYSNSIFAGGQGAAYFDGVNWMTNYGIGTLYPDRGNWTFIFVIKPDDYTNASTTRRTLFSSDGNYGYMKCFHIYENAVGGEHPAWVDQTGTYRYDTNVNATNVSQIVTYALGTNATGKRPLFRRNGVDMFTNDWKTMPLTNRLAVGAQSSSGAPDSGYYKGFIGEIIIYSRRLTDVEIGTIESTLNTQFQCY